MMSISCLIKDFYLKHRNFMNYNKNLVIAAIITAIADIIIVTLSASIFIILLYNDNIIKKEKLRQDSIKFLTTLGLSEISYLVTKFISTYLFFQFDQFDSTQISIATTALAWIWYILTSNILAKRTKILK